MSVILLYFNLYIYSMAKPALSLLLVLLIYGTANAQAKAFAKIYLWRYDKALLQTEPYDPAYLRTHHDECFYITEGIPAQKLQTAIAHIDSARYDTVVQYANNFRACRLVIDLQGADGVVTQSIAINERGQFVFISPGGQISNRKVYHADVAFICAIKELVPSFEDYDPNFINCNISNR